MNLLLTLALFAGAADKVLVIEARVQGGEAQPALAKSVAAAIGGFSPAGAVSALNEQLAVVSTSGMSEPVIEAEHLVQRGRDAYLDGKFAEAAAQLGQARDVLKRAIESFEEERQAAETLFKAHMYLAFTLRARGVEYLREATEAMREAIRTFPTLDPSVGEYGPENVKFYRDVKRQMEQAPVGRLRVRTTGEQASVYLNGRLVGVTPLELRRVYSGRYRLHLREGAKASRMRLVDIGSADQDVIVDLSLDHALQTEQTAVLSYASDSLRRTRHMAHALELAQLVGVRGTLVYWTVGERAELTWVDAQGRARHVTTSTPEAARTAVGLCEGTAGEVADKEMGGESHARVWTWVVGGVSLAALGTAIGLGVSVGSELDELNKRYPNGVVTDPKDFDRLDGARSKASISQVMYGVAGAAAAGAVLLFFYEGHSASNERAALIPVVESGFAGASWTLHF